MRLRLHPLFFFILCHHVAADVKGMYKGKNLNKPPMRTYSGVHMVTQCAKKCSVLGKCKSFSFDVERQRCKVFRTKPDKNFMSDDPNTVLYDIKEFNLLKNLEGPCASDPCHNNGTCIENKNSDGQLMFLCVCSQGWMGTTCSSEAGTLDWDLWSDWTSCSVSCAEGWQSRQRECINTKTKQTHNALECYGTDFEYRRCNIRPCPYWDSWSAWGPCSTAKTCGSGVKVRSRTCLHKGTPGKDRRCMGPLNETAPCDAPSCEAPLKLSGSEQYGEGMLEVYNYDTQQWGAVCPSRWDKTDAKTACLQLGFRGGAHRAYSVKTKSRHFFLTRLECSGHEASLVECPHDGWMDSDRCPHSGGQAAAVACVVDGVWETWSTWGKCDASCNGGQQARKRECRGPFHGGLACDGPEVEQQSCNNFPCPVDGEWYPWERWSSCDVTCGGGSRKRTRVCQVGLFGGKNCTGPSEQTGECNMFACPVDGVWQVWAPWGSCSKTCGGGERSRIRSCRGPYHNGKDCEGPATDKGSCNSDPCPVDGFWHDWSRWSQCTVTCGEGTMTRTRICNQPKHGGKKCVGRDTDNTLCNEMPCPVDGSWSVWGRWQTCNATCGGGIQRRHRVCGGVLHGGKQCGGESEEYRKCNEDPCPVHGVFKPWMTWSQCDVSCGGGKRYRERRCNGPFYGGNDCVGSPRETEKCNTQECPVDGFWNEWSDWATCSLSCGNGTRQRTRTCQRPLHGGRDCEGPAEESSDCFLKECPVDGVWQLWSDWNKCTVTCGGGSQGRARKCIGPFFDGKDCQGANKETRTCNMDPCPVDGVWRAWEKWSECSTTCGGGFQTRVRECKGPFHGGKKCQGLDKEKEQCNTFECPFPGKWMDWEPWGSCTKTCGSGTRVRTRQCDMDSFGELTATCPGDNSTVEPCNQYSCTPLAKNCHEWVQRGLINTAYVGVDPDGTHGFYKPFKILCDIKGDNGRGLSIVHHKNEERIHVEGYEGMGEYKLYLKYIDDRGSKIDIDQVISLVDSSLQCSQFMKWECRESVIHSPNKTKSSQMSQSQVTYWSNRWEETMYYFGGAEPDSEGCACYETRSCADPTKKCNCDKNDAEWRSDEGNITQKHNLPMTVFNAGDTGKIGDNEEGYHTIGPLYCTGVNPDYMP